MKRIILALIAFAGSAFGQTCTQITDTLYGSDGQTIASGTLHITATTTVNSGGATVVPKPINVVITNGHLSVCLIPNTYEVVYRTPTTLTKQWIIAAGGPFTVLEVEQDPATSVPSGTIALTQLTSGNATTGQGLCWSGTAWGPGSCGGGAGAVSSVFGRTGAITANTGDYTAAKVTNAVDSTSTYANPTWLTSLAWSKLTSVPSIVNSFNARTGTLLPATGDYTCAQTTNCVDSTGSYTNPAWISSLAWSKLSSVPTLVNSFNTRTGAVTPATGDYTCAQTTNCVDSTGTYANPAWITSLAWAKLTSVPSIVNTFNTRSGAVVPATGDYTCAQTTNCVDQTGTYANPAWITSLAWSKLTSLPSLVNSFNGRTGTLSPASGDYTCAQVTNCSTGPTANQNIRTIGTAFDGGGNALASSITRCTHVAYAGTIQGVTLIADQTGTATVDIKTVAYGSYTGPASASSITASATPALASAIKYSDTTLTGWTTTLAANTEVCFALSSPATLTWIQATIKIAAN